ncbi:YuiB family protein [Neobacillus sp. SM06]|uniref:YuiB family protein n=1 Tax=Neobacillus sp. SM06 TaxID=3422492 RepID=UPI003D2A81BA
MNLVVLLISVLLFFVLFFGIGFLLNMLLRMSWIVAVIYPVISILIIDKIRFIEYFTHTGAAVKDLWQRILSLGAADVIILSSGLAGAITAGIVIKLLRKNGYQMF